MAGGAIAGTAATAGPAAAGSVVLVGAMCWALVRWPALEDRLFGARGSRASEAVPSVREPVTVVSPQGWGGVPPAPGEGVVFVRVVEAAFVVPRDGGVR